MKVIKRNGEFQSFDKEKIKNAILGAFKEVDKEISTYALEKAENISNFIESMDDTLSVEEIQDLVENGLMSTKRKDVARAYITYRYRHQLARDQYKKLMDAVTEKIMARDVQNQNANVDEKSFGGRVGEMDNLVMKHYALEYCMSSMAKENHLNNEIYVHDLDRYAVGMHNCLSIPFDDLLKNGFNTRQTDIRPANSINTAFQLVAVIFQLQSLCQFGGVSATHLDWTLVPYVRKSFFKHYKNGVKFIEDRELDYSFYSELPIDEEDYKIYSPKAYNYAMELTKKELMQAVEGMYHNLNTLQSRSGNQLPFSSINYGTCTLPEGRLVIEALLRGSIKGVGKLHKTPIFPCGIFQLGKGINREEGDPNYDLYQLALESTAKRLYPNYANIDWSVNEGYDKNDPRTYVSTMGCRTYNGYDINGLGLLKDGRGNIAPVTIIMPTLAMQAIEIAKETLDDEQTRINAFIALLDKKIYEARDMLIERFNYICSQSPESAKFMYENGLMVGYNPEEGIRSALKHGTLAIGNLGLAETLQILVGCDHTEEKGMQVAKRIYELFNKRCVEFKNIEKLNFGVYNTPAENLCYTSMKKFQDKYGIIPNVSDKEFFTNSMHVPVWKKLNPFEKIDIESQLTGYSNAGCITYVEFDTGLKNNLKALETVVNYAMDHDIPYFAVNVPNDTCLDCGYCDEIGNTCPECGGKSIARLRRVTGYLTGDYKTAFNKGKQQEVELRIKHRKFNKDQNELLWNYLWRYCKWRGFQNNPLCQRLQFKLQRLS